MSGRGAVDMKCAGVMQLFATLLLRRQRLPLHRDIIFAAFPDEEEGSEFGMAWLMQRSPELIDAEFALNEGGSGFADFGGRPRRLFSGPVSEKKRCPRRMPTVARAGHASPPPASTPA